MPMSRANGSVLSSSLAAGSTGMAMVTRSLQSRAPIMAYRSGSRQHGGLLAPEMPEWNLAGWPAVLTMTGSASVGRRARKAPGRRVPARMDGVSMTPHAKWAIAGIIIGLILFAVAPWYVPLAIILLAIAIPTGAYLMLDESQRRRLRETRRRRQLGN